MAMATHSSRASGAAETLGDAAAADDVDEEEGSGRVIAQSPTDQRPGEEVAAAAAAARFTAMASFVLATSSNPAAEVNRP